MKKIYDRINCAFWPALIAAITFDSDVCGQGAPVVNHSYVRGEDTFHDWMANNAFSQAGHYRI